MITFTIASDDLSRLRHTVESLLTLQHVEWVLRYQTTTDEQINAYFRLLQVTDRRIAEFTPDQPSLHDHFIIPLIQGDRVTQEAKALNEYSLPANARWAYSDSYLLKDGEPLMYAKPDFSPELQLTTNYVQRPIFWGKPSPSMFFQSELDVYFRFNELEDQYGTIHHISYPLYITEHLFTDWRDQLQAARKPAEEYARRLGYNGFRIGITQNYSGYLDRDFFAFDLIFEDDGPGITIIIPTKDHIDVLKVCVESILAKTAYRNYHILIVDNASEQQESLAYFDTIEEDSRIKVVRVPNQPGRGFNYSYVNNQAALVAQTELLCFLNNDTEVLTSAWLSQLVGTARNPQVGEAGALLMFPNSWVQHSGIHFGFLYNKLPVPAFKGLERKEDAYFGTLFTMRNYMAMSAACLAVRRSDFLELGSFDETNFGVAYNDCDYGLRVFATGKRIVYCPQSVLTHFEGYTRGTGIGNDNPNEEAMFLAKYDTLKDVFYNRWLTVDEPNCEIGRIPRFPVAHDGLPQHIVLFTHNLNYEGAPLVMFDLVSALTAETDHLFTIVSPLPGPLSTAYENLGHAVIVENSLGLGGRFDEASLQHLLHRCQSIIGRHNTSMVISNTVLGYHFVLAAEQVGIPGLWIIHESEQPFTHLREHEGVLEYFARMTAAHASQLIFVCESTRDYYKHQLALKHNTSVIYNAVDFSKLAKAKSGLNKALVRKNLGIGKSVQVGLCVGTVCARKRQQDIAQIVKSLEESVADSLVIFIVGDRAGEYSTELHRQVAQLGKRSKCIRIVPETPDPFPYFVAADFFLFCSSMESYPRVLQEALFFDLPVITTDVFGNKEIVSGGKNGLFFNVGDIETAAQHVTKICQDKDFAAKLRANCEPGTRRFSTMQKFAQGYLDVINSTLELRSIE